MFYFQAIKEFSSDLVSHIYFARNGKGYSFLYSIMGFLLNIYDNVNIIAVLGSLMVTGTWLATAKLISMMMKDMGYFKSAIVALPLLIVTGIYSPVIYPFFYTRQLVTQPYHNITYYGMRLFAVFAMIFFYKMFDGYLKKINVFNWIVLALMLVASTSVKPSFFYGFALCLLIFLIIDFFKSGFKAKPLGHIILMGLVVIPSVLIMLSQYIILYVGKTPGAEPSGGIALVWGANFIKYGFKSTVLKIVCSIGFPCLVGLKNIKKMTRFDKFCYIMFFIELIITIMFVETGKRAKDGNFNWGLYCGSYFVFIAAVTNFIKNVIEREKEGKLLTPYPITGFVMLSLHLSSSLSYFVSIMSGEHFFR